MLHISVKQEYKKKGSRYVYENQVQYLEIVKKVKLLIESATKQMK